MNHLFFIAVVFVLTADLTTTAFLCLRGSLVGEMFVAWAADRLRAWIAGPARPQECAQASPPAITVNVTYNYYNGYSFFGRDFGPWITRPLSPGEPGNPEDCGG
ncbi:MAG: hypothetical protein LBR20_06565 [Propionibacteriaceae bacterium]|jgi:hypothetical protein|nr:hypothetical protein [Propionibacteriaceae bacterium]